MCRSWSTWEVEKIGVMRNKREERAALRFAGAHQRLLWLAAAAFLCGCSSSSDQAAKPPENPGPAPALFRAQFETTKGNFVVEVTREMSPHGADRFYQLVKTGFFNDARFFRVLPGFIVQWGINKDPKTSELWRQLNIPDDPVRTSNTRGTITYAKAGPNTRTTQVFINLADNPNLDRSGFSPFGKVVDGMDVIGQLYGGYGEGQPNGMGPDQQMIQMRGNDYLNESYPLLDYIKSAKVQ